ncbi:MAG: hypothetical protein Q4A07_12885, partial [Coriobacteriales bacterium]|nr:hypothetical protein [Coriobacteriales bacterium]
MRKYILQRLLQSVVILILVAFIIYVLMRSLLKLVFCVNLGWFDLGGLIGRNFEQLSAMGQFL